MVYAMKQVSGLEIITYLRVDMLRKGLNLPLWSILLRESG